MKRLLVLSALTFLLTNPGNAQLVNQQKSEEGNAELQRSLLLFDLQALEARALKLNPLARALAKAEIADAAWSLDRQWAKKLLREAYELTLPDENDRTDSRTTSAGSPPLMFDSLERAQGNVRNRILDIARRDKGLADQLSQLGTEKLGSFEGHFRNAVLANRAFKEGDKEGAARYLLQSIAADPTQITAATAINEMAVKERALADRLILQYLERLRTFPLSTQNQSDLRTYSLLGILVLSPRSEQGPIQPPGSAVMRAYLNYMIESLSDLERSEPGYLQRARRRLLLLWAPLQKYAPELGSAFLDLERRSRRPGDSASLPTSASLEEDSKNRYEKSLKEALESSQPDESAIHLAISRGDFDKARKMIEKLADGVTKLQLTEMVNSQEAISLATKGDISGSTRLAEQLNRAISILQVYPLIIGKCAAKKDQPCVTSLAYQAIKQLKRADTTPAIPPAGIPASDAATNRESDPILLSLSKLTKAVASINEGIALEVLDEMVLAANRSAIETGRGWVGFEPDVFKKLAPKNETRVRQAAGNLEDTLRQIVALASIYQWKAAELTEKEQAAH